MKLLLPFRKMFFIGQNLKDIHMTFFFFFLTFNIILINIYLLFCVFFSLHQRNAVWKYHEIKTKGYTFSHFSDTDVQKLKC